MQISFDPGTEIYIPFARRKLTLWKQQMGAAGVGSFHKRVDVSDGSVIYVDSTALGQGRYNDRIRITGGALYGRAMLEPDDSDWNSTTVYFSYGAGVVMRAKTSSAARFGVAGTSVVFPETLTPASVYTRTGWSKDYSTVVVLDANTCQAEIIRGSYHQIVSGVVSFGNQGTDAHLGGAYSSYANQASRGFLYGQYHVGIATDGSTILMRSQTTATLIRCVWNSDTGVYDVTNVAATLEVTGTPVYRMWLNPYTGTDVVVEAYNTATTGGAADGSNGPPVSGVRRLRRYSAVTGEWTDFYESASSYFEVSRVGFEPTSKEPHRFSWTPSYWGYWAPYWQGVSYGSFTLYRDGVAWVTGLAGPYEAGGQLTAGAGWEVGVDFLGDAGRGVVRSYGGSSTGFRGFVWRGVDGDPEVRIPVASAVGPALYLGAAEVARVCVASKTGRYFYHIGSGGGTNSPLQVYRDGVLIYTTPSTSYDAGVQVLYRTSHNQDGKVEVYYSSGSVYGLRMMTFTNSGGAWTPKFGSVLSTALISSLSDVEYSYPNPADPEETLYIRAPGRSVLFDEFVP